MKTIIAEFYFKYRIDKFMIMSVIIKIFFLQIPITCFFLLSTEVALLGKYNLSKGNLLNAFCL